MNNTELLNIIRHVREVTIKNFEILAHKTNTDIGHLMVTFNIKTLNTRKINDWGRDEDEDWYIGIDKNGWIIYTHFIEYLVGEPIIKEPKIQSIDDSFIINYLTSDNCEEKHYLDFMSKCIDIRKQCFKDFKL